MKIILDIPDTIVCAFFGFVRFENDFHGMTMQGQSISSDELYDGSEIIIKSVDKESYSNIKEKSEWIQG